MTLNVSICKMGDLGSLICTCSYHITYPSLLGHTRVTGAPPGRGTGAETLGPSCGVEGVFTLLIDSPAPEATARDLATVLSRTSPLGRVEGRARGTHGVTCITEGSLSTSCSV